MAQGTPQPAVQPVVLQAPQQIHHLPQQTPAYSVSANWARVQPNNSMQIYVAQPQQVKRCFLLSKFCLPLIFEFLVTYLHSS